MGMKVIVTAKYEEDWSDEEIDDFMEWDRSKTFEDLYSEWFETWRLIDYLNFEFIKTDD